MHRHVAFLLLLQYKYYKVPMTKLPRIIDTECYAPGMRTPIKLNIQPRRDKNDEQQMLTVIT